MLHHYNAPAHSSLLIRQFLAKNQTPVFPQPPYSPDLAPCDFFLFPKLKSMLKGRRFQTIDDINPLKHGGIYFISLLEKIILLLHGDINLLPL